MSKQTEQSTPTNTPAFFTLPYSGDKVPAALEEITLKIKGEFATHDGIAFGAEVRRNGKLIGNLENQGTGGGTWFHHHNVEVMNWWRERELEMKRILVEVEGDTDFMAEEIMADRLYDNAALYKELNRKRSPIIRINHDNDNIRGFKGTWDAPLEAGLKARAAKEGATYERWIKNKGWEAI